ncbi:MAG: hypothetical protein HY855_10990 [Burkholderiales bacterium]|nr:hypothetical protein [Burkholderiales bacterium]
MKLIATIKPRTDGTVLATGPSKQDYVFKMDVSTGDPTCEVEDEADIAHFLGTGNFEPADEADFERADQLVQKPADGDAGGGDGGGDGGGNDSDPDSLPDDIPSDPNALPVESGTAPAPAAGRGKGGRAR